MTFSWEMELLLQDLSILGRRVESGDEVEIGDSVISDDEVLQLLHQTAMPEFSSISNERDTAIAERTCTPNAGRATRNIDFVSERLYPGCI